MTSLSILDQSPIREGGSPAEALRETIRLAVRADALGYARYWVAEHHNTPAFAGTTPEILVGRLAAATTRIRVGSGGVMLTHYSPLKVAENFLMLEALHPGRIDLGIGRAPGSDQLSMYALQPGPQAYPLDYFPEQVRNLIRWLRDEVPDDHPFAQVHANPRTGHVPDLWLLGSGAHSALYAAAMGVAFCHAHFINDEAGPEVMAAYRDRFTPSALDARPRAAIGISVLCAETEAEAWRLHASRELMAVRRRAGRFGRVPSVEEALSYNYTAEEKRFIEARREKAIVGDPGGVKARILALGETYGVEDFVIVTITHDYEARARSYELLAAAFGLPAPA